MQKQINLIKKQINSFHESTKNKLKILRTNLKLMENKISRSPLPTEVEPIKEEFDEILKDEEMSFPVAIRDVIDGKKIHKLEWKDKEYYGFLKDGILCLHKPDGKTYQWVLSDGDLNGNDYIVIN